MKPLPSLLLFCLLSAPALAQTPDTTAARRYLPLAPGHTWEYKSWEEERMRPHVSLPL